MTCGTCIRWRRLRNPKDASYRWRTSYGFCMWPGLGPKPYWLAERPEAVIMTAETSGKDCPALKERRR